MVGAVDRGHADLHVEVPPHRGPVVADLGEPRPPLGDRRTFGAGRRRQLVELDDVEGLEPLVRYGEEAAPVVRVPPRAVPGDQPVGPGGEGPVHRPYGVRGRPRHVPGEAVHQVRGQQSPGSLALLTPGGGPAAAREQRLLHEAVTDPGVRVGGVVVGLAAGAGGGRLQPLEAPGGGLLARARPGRDQQGARVVLDECGEGEGAAGGGEGAVQLRVVGVERPVDRGDLPGQGEREVPDGQPRVPRPAAPLAALVLDLGVAEHHLQGVRRRTPVELGAEVAVGEERGVLPARRKPPPLHGRGADRLLVRVGSVPAAPGGGRPGGTGTRQPERGAGAGRRTDETSPGEFSHLGSSCSRWGRAVGGAGREWRWS